MHGFVNFHKGLSALRKIGDIMNCAKVCESVVILSLPYFCTVLYYFDIVKHCLILLPLVLLYSNRLLLLLVLPLFNRHGSVREQCLTELVHSV